MYGSGASGGSTIGASVAAAAEPAACALTLKAAGGGPSVWATAEPLLAHGLGNLPEATTDCGCVLGIDASGGDSSGASEAAAAEPAACFLSLVI